MKTYINRIKPGGVSVLFETVPAGYHFKKTIGNDSFELYESEAGIYITVTTYKGEICCCERLYGMSRNDQLFWMLSRNWSGEGHKQDVKYKRDDQYPVGKQVRLGKCLSRANQKSSPLQSTQSNSSTTASVGSSTVSV